MIRTSSIIRSAASLAQIRGRMQPSKAARRSVLVLYALQTPTRAICSEVKNKHSQTAAEGTLPTSFTASPDPAVVFAFALKAALISSVALAFHASWLSE